MDKDIIKAKVKDTETKVNIIKAKVNSVRGNILKVKVNSGRDRITNRAQHNIARVITNRVAIKEETRDGAELKYLIKVDNGTLKTHRDTNININTNKAIIKDKAKFMDKVKDKVGLVLDLD